MGSDHGGGVSLSWGGHMSHAVCKADKLLPIPDGVESGASSSIEDGVPSRTTVCVSASPCRKSASRSSVSVRSVTWPPSSTPWRERKPRACDVSPRRVEQARGAGIDGLRAKTLSKRPSLKSFRMASMRSSTAPESPAFPKAIELCRDLPWGNHQTRGPRYIVQGSYPDAFSVPYGPSFMREVSIIFPRSEQDRDRVVVFDLIKRGAITLTSVISDVCKPSTANKVYEALRDPATNLMTVVFDWTSEGPVLLERHGALALVVRGLRQRARRSLAMAASIPLDPAAPRINPQVPAARRDRAAAPIPWEAVATS